MRRLLALSVLVLAACGGGGDTGGTVTPPPTPTIALSLSAAAGTVARGATGTTTVTVARGGNYTGAVTVAASNLPAGVTAAFTPTSLSGATTSSVATFTVGATATPGTSNITITGTGDGVAASTTTYALTVPSPSIALTAGAGALSVVQGAAGTVPITITRSNGYADAVTLAVTGLPTGVTAAFAPATIAAGSTTSTLTLTVAGTTAAATTPLTITASGTGVTAQTATVNLTVTAAATPAISLTAAPAAVTMVAGANGASVITLARSGGFAGDVALASTGAPAGMTVALTPATIAAGSTTSNLAITTTTAVIPGTYNLTITGTGAGVAAQSAMVAVTVNQAPGVTITAIAAQQLSQGSSSATAIPLVLTRVGGLAGDLTMSLEGAPAGVTAAFTPNPVTGAGTQMTLTATPAAAAGTYTLTVRATGAGNVSGTASFQLTVTTASQGSYVMNATPSTLTVQQGQTGLSTINIARAGGFTGAVTLAASGLPTGATATFNPNALTGTQSTLGIAVGAATPAGTYTITVTGTAVGLTNVTTTLSLTVTATPTGGTGNVSVQFCDLNELPLWVAYRSGTTGAWTPVSAGANNTYSFTINGVGGMAWVKPTTGGVADVTIWYGTAAQLTQFGQQECVSSPATKSLTGSFAGLTGAQTGSVSIGGGFAQSTIGVNTFSVQNVANGSTDLLAYRSTQGLVGGVFATVPDKGVIRRGVNYAAGSAIPVIDFNGTESFTPASAQVTVNNAGSGLLQVFSSFQTGNGTIGGFTFGALVGGTNPFSVYGVPSNLTAAGDFHLVQATSTTIVNNAPSESRSATQFNRELANRTLTLGPSLTLPTYATLSTTPYARIRATGNWQTEYGDQLFAYFQQPGGSSRNWTISVTRGYTGNGASYDFEIPDFTGLAGWNNTWGLVAGVQTQIGAFAYSAGNATTTIEGLVALTAGRFGTYTP